MVDGVIIVLTALFGSSGGGSVACCDPIDLT